MPSCKPLVTASSISFPIFLGYTAAKKFGLKQFVGMAIGAAMVYPALSGLTANTEPLYTLFNGTILSHLFM